MSQYTMNLHLTPEMPDVCLSFVLLFTIFIIVVTKKLVLQQSKNVTAKCTENLSPPPSIQFSLQIHNSIRLHIYGFIFYIASLLNQKFIYKDDIKIFFQFPCFWDTLYIILDLQLEEEYEDHYQKKYFYPRRFHQNLGKC